MSKKDLPIIFILDMDKCIIGDSDYLYSYSLFINDFLVQNGKHRKFNEENYRINKGIWKKDVPSNFLRPYLKEFINEVKKIFPTSEFFIFSFGIRSYVNDFIQFVEETIDFKFNRPLLTREDKSISIDGFMIKDVRGYMEQFFKTIKSKYPNIDLASNEEFIYNNRLIIIDDIPEFWNDNPKLVICNPYEYTPIPIIDNQLLKLIRDNQDLISFINNTKNSFFPKYLKPLSPDYTYDDFYIDYHLQMSYLYRSNYQKNKEAIKDEFFKNLLISIKPRAKLTKPFTPEFIQTLNKK